MAEPASVKKGKGAASADEGLEGQSETKSHAGGCHCGKVRYEMTAEIGKAMSCNCSICTKSGSLLAFIPASQFKLLSGQDEMIDYQFNKHVIHHMVCPDCGIKSFARAAAPDGTAMVAINMRCVDGIDLKTL